MSGEQDFNREVMERLARIETKLEMLATVERMAIAEESSKSAHKRIDELELKEESDKDALSKAIDKTEKRVYWVGGVVFTVAQVIINFFMRQ